MTTTPELSASLTESLCLTPAHVARRAQAMGSTLLIAAQEFLSLGSAAVESISGSFSISLP